jgi:hypothetical protein
VQIEGYDCWVAAGGESRLCGPIEQRRSCLHAVLTGSSQCCALAHLLGAERNYSSRERPRAGTTAARSAAASACSTSPTPSPISKSASRKAATACGRSTFTRSCWPRSTNAITSFRANSRVTDVAGPKCYRYSRSFTRETQALRCGHALVCST